MRLSIRPIAAVVAAFACGVSLGAAPRPAAATAPDAGTLVQRVADAYTQQSAGVVAFRTHVTVRSTQRLLPKDQVDDAWFVLEDGRVARSGGDPSGPAAAEAAAHQPYNGRYSGEYTFAPAPCAGCAADAVAVAYTGAPHDALHGRGVLVIDTRTARIIRSTTEPYVVPKPGRSGTLVTTWGTTPAGWYPIATDGAFVGRVGPFSGRAVLTQRFSAYQRYHDLATAAHAFGR